MFEGKKLPRMFWWGVLCVALAAFVAWRSPAQVPVVAYKLLLVNLAALVAHVLDRTFFRDPTPNDEIARAIVFVGVVLGLTLGI